MLRQLLVKLERWSPKKEIFSGFLRFLFAVICRKLNRNDTGTFGL